MVGKEVEETEKKRFHNGSGGGGEKQKDLWLLIKNSFSGVKRPYIAVMRAPAMTEEGDGVSTKMKSKLRAKNSKSFHQSPQPESREELLSWDKEAHWGPGVWERGWDSRQDWSGKDRLPVRSLGSPMSWNVLCPQEPGKRSDPHAHEALVLKFRAIPCPDNFLKWEGTTLCVHGRESQVNSLK